MQLDLLTFKFSLQLSVSLLREAALRDSLSYWAPSLQFFKFRHTLTILRCIQEIRALETHIEVCLFLLLKEGQVAKHDS